MPTPPTKNANSPDYVRPDVLALRPARLRSRTLAAGTDAVHAARETILPKWPGEDAEFYDVRRTLTEVFDAYGRTVEASSGLLFGTDPAIENMPPVLQDFLDDATGQGEALCGLAADVATSALLDGVAGILVDYPRVNVGTVSLRDVQEQQLRPYAVPIEAAQILSWRTARRGARTYLTQLVLRESHEAPDSAFGIELHEQYRVFRHNLATDLVTVTVYRVTEALGVKSVVEVEPEAAILGPKEIPFAHTPLLRGPLLDRLAWLNIGHYRVSADHRYLMSICHAPTLKIEGGNGEAVKVKLGVNCVLVLSGEQKADWLQALPNALTSSEVTMERIQQQMGALGMAFLARDKTRTQETATGRALDAAAEHATLGSLGDEMAEMLERVLGFAGDYLQVDASAVEVSIRPDYDTKALDAPTILALSKLAELNQITLETLLTTLKDGNVLPDSFDVEAEELELVLQAMGKPSSEETGEPVPVAA